MTDDAETTAPDTATDDHRGAGTLLQEARTARGMSSAELAAELRLSEAQVDALEAEDHAALPPAPFVRGYLRSSARLLDIDADTLVAAYDESPENPGATRLKVSTQDEDRVAFPPKLALLLLLLLPLGGAAAWWFWGDPPALVTTEEQGTGAATEVADADVGVVDEPEESESAEPQLDAGGAEAVEPVEPATIEPPVVDAPDVSTEAPIVISPDLLVTDPDGAADPDLSAQRDAEIEAMFEQVPVDVSTLEPNVSAGTEGGIGEVDGTDIDTGTDAAAADVDAAADSGTTADTATDAAGAADDNGPHELVLRAEDETWVEVFDDRDRRLAYALYAGDEPLALRGLAPFRVFLGNAPVVNLEFDGEPVDASAFVRANDTARFRVGEDGVIAP